MNEFILLGIVILILIGSHIVLRRIKNPFLFYIRLIAAIGLMLLIWLSNPEKNQAFRIVMTVVVLAYVYREYLSMKKLKAEK